jgi:hypothetical protein
MVIKAYSLQTKILVELPDRTISYRLERRNGCGGPWLVLTDSGYVPDGGGITPLPVSGVYLDSTLFNGICQYRVRNYADETSDWDHTVWLRCGNTDPVGITFGNYQAPEGSWGDIITTDDLRFSYCWGVDFRASNGASFSDAQIQYYIDAALTGIARELNITIKKTRVMCEPERRGAVKGRDYDVAESYHEYKREQVQRYGGITTLKRPVISISRLDLFNRNDKITSLLNACTYDKTKGKIKFFNRLPRMSDSARGIEAAISPWGPGSLERNLFYAIDYTAGFESADDVPIDLREIIGKQAAVSLLNVIGRGLMSGFSSSSLSMDGVSESFSSTQSATSAYYGADIKEYKDDIENYIAANKHKLGHIVMGAW